MRPTILRARSKTPKLHRLRGATMPMGENSPVAGYLAFCAVKAVGYTAAAAVISRIYSRTDRNALVVGATRTLIGINVGAALYACRVDGVEFFYGTASGIAALIAVRLAEWWLVLCIYYDRNPSSPRGWAVAVGGSVWSFVLDIPAVIGYIIAAGVWIC